MAEARSLTSGGWLISGWARWRAWAGPPGACWVKGAMIALVCGGGAPVWRWQDDLCWACPAGPTS